MASAAMTRHGIVAGFPRSGTSAAMRLLSEAGIPIFYQGEHFDEFNPQGYFEAPQIMAACMNGSADKVLDSLDGLTFKMPLPHHLEKLPTKGRKFFVIWMERDPMQSAISLRKLNFSRGAKFQPDPETLAANIERVRARALEYLTATPVFHILRVPQSELDSHVPAMIAHLRPVSETLSHPLPTAREMLARFGNAAHNFARSGFATTPPEALATREATCRACPEWDAAALNNTGRCKKCGCSTWAKLRMATERCPLGKWEAHLTPQAK